MPKIMEENEYSFRKVIFMKSKPRTWEGWAILNSYRKFDNPAIHETIYGSSKRAKECMISQNDSLIKVRITEVK
jgi:hypothetical protein